MLNVFLFCCFANWYRCCANTVNFGQTAFFAGSSESRINWLDWTVFPEFFSAREINQVFPKPTLPGHSESALDDENQHGRFSSCFHFYGNQISRALKTPDTHGLQFNEASAFQDMVWSHCKFYWQVFIILSFFWEPARARALKNTWCAWLAIQWSFCCPYTLNSTQQDMEVFIARFSSCFHISLNQIARPLNPNEGLLSSTYSPQRSVLQDLVWSHSRI